MKRNHFIAILMILALFITCRNPDSNIPSDVNQTYIVTFDKNHQDADGWTEASPGVKAVTAPATTVGALPTAPTRAGHDFVNWKDGSGADFDETTPVNRSITVYAQWQPKSAGGTVAAPTLYAKAHNWIMVNMVSAPANGQDVEYAISTGTTPPSSGWQSSVTFTGLTPNTTYYVFARAKGDAHHGPGAAQISAAIKTDTTATITPTDIVDFEGDTVGKTYDSAKGTGTPTVAVAADPANSGQKSLQINSSNYNQAAIIPINLPYTLESYKSVTFKFNYTSGSLTNQQILVYAAKNTNTFVQYGFGNPADHSNQNQQFAANLVGSVTPIYSSTNQWQSLSITITNPGSAIKDLQGNIFLAIGIHYNGNITYLLDDITFNIKDGFDPPPPPPPKPPPPNPPSVGAVVSGNYRNLFQEFGKTNPEINAKVQGEWNKKFVNGTTDEMLYVQASDSSMAYIYTADTDDVRSEGMSYGMMMCVQMDDQVRFNKLWKWAHTYMYHDRDTPNTGKNVRGFFSWQCGTNGTAKDTGPAPDGEFYFVTALLFAENRWGNGSGINNYGQYARYIMYDMLHREPGVKDNYGAIPMINATYKIPEFTTVTAQHTDASYMLPAFYDVWAMEIRAGTSYHNSIWGSQSAAEADATYWEEVATSCRDYLKNSGVLNATTGLGPDYSSYTGSPGSHGDFEYDAWRIAMNIGMDYAWFAKDTWQKTQSDRIQAFFYGQGVTSYGNRYTLSGNKLGPDHSPGLVACNAVASLAATHERAWEFVENLWDIPVTTGKFRYYDGCLYMMGLLHVSGKFKAYLSSGSTVTPSSNINPTTATFDKNTAGANYKDIAVTMTLNGNTLSSISGGSPAITTSNYTVSGSTVTIKKEYLATQTTNSTTLTFNFSAGSAKTIAITIGDTTGGGPIGETVLEYTFNSDVTVTFAPSGSTSTAVRTVNGGNNVLQVTIQAKDDVVILPFNLGSTTLANYASLYVEVAAISGDSTYKSFAAQVTTGTFGKGDSSSNTTIARQNGNALEGTNSWKTYTIPLQSNSGAVGALTGPVNIAFWLPNANPGAVYQIRVLRLIP